VLLRTVVCPSHTVIPELSTYIYWVFLQIKRCWRHKLIAKHCTSTERLNDLFCVLLLSFFALITISICSGNRAVGPCQFRLKEFLIPLYGSCVFWGHWKLADEGILRVKWREIIKYNEWQSTRNQEVLDRFKVNGNFYCISLWNLNFWRRFRSIGFFFLILKTNKERARERDKRWEMRDERLATRPGYFNLKAKVLVSIERNISKKYLLNYLKVLASIGRNTSKKYLLIYLTCTVKTEQIYHCCKSLCHLICFVSYWSHVSI